ncbi:MAG: ribose 5-phosphate isomerase B [Gemmatimonadota bacterium]|nr:ribose 5-phosphate isomerase B [Gemmatimonadota bacterium]MDH3366324.1 ribose 5-phosphate isomerase B [Gemmatimonadota bacterium]MDH3477064.1 ribose 5-phosphate isomerase B [Gemmatimonadota bacterium]MDH3569591.1 ribose 5-phosphate isomerase B [Gemmatimonadota bacterium]MDH5550166.1 ribose 5-phosphate isomerase B [Gemmatimonadota bacterium]
MRPQSVPEETRDRTVAVGADHGGFELKDAITEHLRARGYAVTDLGTNSSAPVDYPDLAEAVARRVAGGDAWRGIVVDGAGVGSCMVANKVPGVRAAACYDQATAINSRAHNDANVLTLGSAIISRDTALAIVGVWLETPAEGGRHARRVGKIMDIERRSSGGTTKAPAMARAPGTMRHAV